MGQQPGATYVNQAFTYLGRSRKECGDKRNTELTKYTQRGRAEPEQTSSDIGPESEEQACSTHTTQTLEVQQAGTAQDDPATAPWEERGMRPVEMNPGTTRGADETPKPALRPDPWDTPLLPSLNIRNKLTTAAPTTRRTAREIVVCPVLHLPCCYQEVKVKVLVAQSCQTLWDPTDCSPPGSSVHGIF